MMAKGKLYLIPNVIAESTQEGVIPASVIQVLPTISHFLAEDLRTARRYLSSLKIYPSMEALHFKVLNKDTRTVDIPELLSPLKEGYNLGIISESGCPGIADPGAVAVHYAHQNKIQVVPLVGPSSIFLALMASGLNGQRFAFHGYLPVEAKEAGQTIRELEKESKQKNQTQIFIETPYRNNSVFEYLLKNLHAETRLTVAIDLTSKDEQVKTMPAREWSTQKPIWPKSPAIFMFLA